MFNFFLSYSMSRLAMSFGELDKVERGAEKKVLELKSWMRNEGKSVIGKIVICYLVVGRV